MKIHRKPLNEKIDDSLFVLYWMSEIWNDRVYADRYDDGCLQDGIWCVKQFRPEPIEWLTMRDLVHIIVEWLRLIK